jgi:uncharacterized coiled-coil protein SlyX
MGKETKEDVERKLAEEQNKTKDLQQTIAELNKTIEDGKKENEELNNKNQELINKIQALEKELQQLKDTKNNKLTAEARTITGLQKQVADAKATIANQQKEIDELTAKLAPRQGVLTFGANNRIVNDDAADIDDATAATLYRAMKQQFEDELDVSAALKAQLDEFKVENEQIKGNLDRQLETIADLNKRLADAEADLVNRHESGSQAGSGIGGVVRVETENTEKTKRNVEEMRDKVVIYACHGSEKLASDSFLRKIWVTRGNDAIRKCIVEVKVAKELVNILEDVPLAADNKLSDDPNLVNFIAKSVKPKIESYKSKFPDFIGQFGTFVRSFADCKNPQDGTVVLEDLEKMSEKQRIKEIYVSLYAAICNRERVVIANYGDVSRMGRVTNAAWTNSYNEISDNLLAYSSYDEDQYKEKIGSKENTTKHLVMPILQATPTVAQTVVQPTVVVQQQPAPAATPVQAVSGNGAVTNNTSSKGNNNHGNGGNNNNVKQTHYNHTKQQQNKSQHHGKQQAQMMPQQQQWVMPQPNVTQYYPQSGMMMMQQSYPTLTGGAPHQRSFHQGAAGPVPPTNSAVFGCEYCLNRNKKGANNHSWWGNNGLPRCHFNTRNIPHFRMPP